MRLTLFSLIFNLNLAHELELRTEPSTILIQSETDEEKSIRQIEDDIPVDSSSQAPQNDSLLLS